MGPKTITAVRLISATLLLLTLGACRDRDDQTAAPPTLSREWGEALASPSPGPAKTPASTYPEETSAPIPEHARRVLRDHGYELTWSFYTDRGMSGVTGTRDRRDGTTGMHAFLFYDGRFVGLDAPEESEWVGVRPSQGEFVMLLYAVYQEGDKPCEPFREAEVLFGWDGEKITNPHGSGPPPPVEARSPRCREAQ